VKDAAAILQKFERPNFCRKVTRFSHYGNYATVDNNLGEAVLFFVPRLLCKHTVFMLQRDFTRGKPKQFEPPNICLRLRL